MRFIEKVTIDRNNEFIGKHFRIMETDFKVRSVYLQNKNRIDTDSLICFIS